MTPKHFDDTHENMRILVVEDNRINLFVLMKYLKNIDPDFDITVTMNGADFVEAASNDFDVMLCDHYLPNDFNVDSALQDVRDDGVRTMCFIITSDINIVKEDYPGMDVTEVLHKPIRQNSLRRILDMVPRA